MSFLSIFTKPAESAADTFTTKLKSPFFGTFIIVWIIRNRLFIYDLFYNTKIDKRSILNNHFEYSTLGFWYRLAITLLITLLILLIYYIALNLSRLLTVFSEENLKLTVYKTLGSKRYVDKELHERIKKAYDKTINENTILEESNSKFRTEKENIDTKLLKSNELLSSTEKDLNTSLSQIESQKETIRIDSEKLIVTEELLAIQQKENENLNSEINHSITRVTSLEKGYKNAADELSVANNMIKKLEQSNFEDKQKIEDLNDEILNVKEKFEDLLKEVNLGISEVNQTLGKNLSPKGKFTLMRASQVKNILSRYLIHIKSKLASINID